MNMNKVLRILFLLWGYSSAEIIQISSLSQIFDHIDMWEESLVLFDMQDTLVRSVFYKLDHSVQDTLRIHLQPLIGHIMDIKWLFIKAIESNTCSVVTALEKKGALVAVLTGNHHLEGSHIFYQLAIAGVQLSSYWDMIPKFNFVGSKSYAFADRGVISTGYNKKSEILFKFLECVALKPRHIIFIDNSRACLEDVAAEAEAHSIPFTGFWYVHPKYYVSEDRYE